MDEDELKYLIILGRPFLIIRKAYKGEQSLRIENKMQICNILEDHMELLKKESCNVLATSKEE